MPADLPSRDCRRPLTPSWCGANRPCRDPPGRWWPGLLAAALACAAAPARGAAELADLSLEQLGNIEITSVAKRGQRLADAAASIYVISNEQIRRAGARTLPEALRLAPNLQVARINASQYAISARGGNGSTANKLLVLVDGRSIYTPLYSGVFWDAQDVLLEDVERIEVISGAGGTLWGANAVNGVINVISKRAADSLGTLAQTALGRQEQHAALRHGAQIDAADVRVYAKADRRRHSERADGRAAVDAWEHGQLGGRVDLPALGGALSLHAGLYRERIDQPLLAAQRHHGAHLLAHWERPLDEGGRLMLQGFYDLTRRHAPGSYAEDLQMLDLEWQYLPAAGATSQWTWGGGHRVARDKVDNLDGFAFLPSQRRLRWSSLFGQYERSLLPALSLTLGSKLEHNDYSGLELMPSARLAWKYADTGLLWLALARAVRTPSRFDTEFFIPAQAPFALAGGPGFRAELANSVDLGWRAQPSEGLSVSITAFGVDYARLRGFEIRPDRSAVWVNAIRGHVTGLEAWASYQLERAWSMHAGATLLRERFSGPNVALSPYGSDPRFQWQLASRWDIGNGIDLDLALRRVDRLAASPVPAYTVVDARLAWRGPAGVELALEGRNLFGRAYREFAESGGARAPSPIRLGRELALAVTLRY